MQALRLSVQILVLALLPALGHAQVISIAAARAQGAGATVTVRGIVTNGSELGKIRYLQDGTAGMAAFPNSASVPNFDTSVQAGDSIEVSGTLVQFQNLLEITPITAFSIISSGNPLPAPKSIGLAQVSEDFESQLVSTECVTFGGAGGTFSSSGTYDISDADGGQAKVYLRGAHPLIGSAIPTGSVRLTSILSQFGDYQLLPRSASDLVAAPCFFILQKPTVSNLSTSGFSLQWATNLPGTTVLKYGTSPTNLDQTVSVAGESTTHSATLTGLSAGTIYWVQARSMHNSQSAQTDVIPFATVSNSTGEIRVYFNHTIDNQFVGNKNASGQSFEECRDAIIERMDAAQQTIDVAIYNCNRYDLVDALVAAHQRGVRVRVVVALETSNVAFEQPLPFEVVEGNDIALMHNKFMVIDAHSVNESWVMSGSLNWTNANMQDDFNNLLFVQDQSLARTYVVEFEEMWGSSTAQSNPANQRFGSAKRDNTPHQFVIDGIAVESYFSPSDGVTDQIVRTILSADASAEFALLTFTKNEPGDALAYIFNEENVAVRGLIDNVNDNGSEFDFLVGQGVPVAAHTFAGVLHHKYVVVDALQPTSDPTVLTGSHNWSFSAETQNDENTLVIHDADIARLFRAEFEQRATENPITSIREVLAERPFAVWPNPTSDFFVLKNALATSARFSRIELCDRLGRVVLQAPLQVDQPVSIGHLPAGSYWLKIIGSDGFVALPLQKI
jgi:phosphatidylserine/phosphatidylglycerophosphate/cardiolipin synthase-like enzyme